MGEEVNRKIMKRPIKILVVTLLIAGSGIVLSGCSDPRIHTSAGVNMTFGPGGPHVSPSFNVGVYGGGRR